MRHPATRQVSIWLGVDRRNEYTACFCHRREAGLPRHLRQSGLHAIWPYGCKFVPDKAVDLERKIVEVSRGGNTLSAEQAGGLVKLAKYSQGILNLHQGKLTTEDMEQAKRKVFPIRAGDVDKTRIDSNLEGVTAELYYITQTVNILLKYNNIFIFITLVFMILIKLLNFLLN